VLELRLLIPANASLIHVGRRTALDQIGGTLLEHYCLPSADHVQSMQHASDSYFKEHQA
jgi:hypothetical protein